MNERAKVVAQALFGQCWHFRQDDHAIAHIATALDTLPEFNPSIAEWIKCSERMPEEHHSVYFAPKENQRFGIRAGFYDGFRWRFTPESDDHFSVDDVTHWMPRIVPAPPVEEGSELVKALTAHWNKKFHDDRSFGDTFSECLKIVKEFERKGATK